MNPTGQPETTLDRERFLPSAAARLADEFTGTFSVEVVEDLLHSSYRLLARDATVTTFLPLLTERFARQRLQALALTGAAVHGAAPAVLFLCVQNAGRSQMALGLFTHYAGAAAVAWSGGSEPGAEVDPTVLATMAERGINISAEFPKPWTAEVLRAADVVITMGCGDVCPVLPGKRYEDWAVGDPTGAPLDDVRAIRDELDARVRALLTDLLPGLPLPTP